jgi:hypothetical protein
VSGYRTGARARFGKHVPDGIHTGVRRGVGSSGAIMYNGHPHVPAELRADILAFLTRLGRPTTVCEVAQELHHSSKHVRRTMASMRVDGDLAGWQTSRRTPMIYELPTTAPGAPAKTCSQCGSARPLTDFHSDKSQPDGRYSRCRFCRSPYADKTRVSVNRPRRATA